MVIYGLKRLCPAADRREAYCSFLRSFRRLCARCFGKATHVKQSHCESICTTYLCESSVHDLPPGRSDEADNVRQRDQENRTDSHRDRKIPELDGIVVLSCNPWELIRGRAMISREWYQEKSIRHKIQKQPSVSFLSSVKEHEPLYNSCLLCVLRKNGSLRSRRARFGGNIRQATRSLSHITHPSPQGSSEARISIGTSVACIPSALPAYQGHKSAGSGVRSG